MITVPICKAFQENDSERVAMPQTEAVEVISKCNFYRCN